MVPRDRLLEAVEPVLRDQRDDLDGRLVAARRPRTASARRTTKYSSDSASASRPVSFCLVLRPPPSSATVRSATSAKLREHRQSWRYHSAVPCDAAGALPNRPPVRLWNSAPNTFERRTTTWPRNAFSNAARPLRLVRVLRGRDFLVEIGMRAQRALRERDQRARQDVGAFDGDADRHHLVGRLQVVRRPVADARGRRACPSRR